MHPEVALAMAHARQQDLRRLAGPHGFSNPRALSWAARPRWRLLPGPHVPRVSRRMRLGH